MGAVGSAAEMAAAAMAEVGWEVAKEAAATAAVVSGAGWEAAATAAVGSAAAMAAAAMAAAGWEAATEEAATAAAGLEEGLGAAAAGWAAAATAAADSAAAWAAAATAKAGWEGATAAKAGSAAGSAAADSQKRATVRAQRVPGKRSVARGAPMKSGDTTSEKNEAYGKRKKRASSWLARAAGLVFFAQSWSRCERNAYGWCGEAAEDVRRQASRRFAVVADVSNERVSRPRLARAVTRLCVTPRWATASRARCAVKRGSPACKPLPNAGGHERD